MTVRDGGRVATIVGMHPKTNHLVALVALFGAALHATLHAAPLPAVDATWTPKLKRAVAASADAFVVGAKTFEQDGRTYLYLVTQQPSRSNRGAGYCGAGTEDVLRLVEVSKPSLRMVERDSLLVQSCLETIELEDDSGASLRERLGRFRTPGSLWLTWLSHPKFGSKPMQVKVRDARLLLE